jgi:SpoVK/Ycf46/Vps4 family AAA+-type ATPase
LCTNRPEAIDPAIVRRVVAILPFTRPNDDQRRQLLDGLLHDSGIKASDLDKLVALTGPCSDRGYGCTYSDIRQRLVPDAVLDAFRRDAPLTGEAIIALAEHFEPTRPFSEGS